MRLSRIAKTVARLEDVSPDAHLFADKRVLLTGEADVLATDNGREALLFSLRLLVRISRAVDVALPVGCAALANEAQTLAHEIGLGGVSKTGEALDFAGYAAVLSIGKTARPELPFTVINSNGWLARVSSGKTSLSGDCAQCNPIGARLAANLGVAEVFKRIAAVKPNRGHCSTTCSSPALPTGVDLKTRARLSPTSSFSQRSSSAAAARSATASRS